MTVTYRFKNHDIRTIFIDGVPWLFGPDLAACLEMAFGALDSLVGAEENGGNGGPKRLWVLPADDGDKNKPICCYSVAATKGLTPYAPFHLHNEFKIWLNTLFDNGAVVAKTRRTETCDHLGVLADRMYESLTALEGLTDLIGAISEGGEPVNEINTRGLTRLLDKIRLDFEGVNAVIHTGCQCANGKHPAWP